ncbi:sporulation kinase [Jeotgalibacillus soli]|uniref:histidine kinase n=1 Tax=Jeotgalibacillus soli TaxID=889306 RepID=A0A0C2S6K4_9BACL|nr:sporulation kinase [Jeotgalibacillus soli]
MWLETGVILILLIAGIMMLKKYRAVRRLLKEMEEEEFKMTALIQSMPDFVCFKDGEGRWIRTNDFGRSLYELENISYIGKSDSELGEMSTFFKEALDYCVVSDEKTWKKAETTRSEEAFHLRSGELKTFDVIKVPIFHEDGSRKALITIGRDISQQKAAEERLVKQEKLSVAGELAAGIAHEIRNPLTSLKGFVQLMREDSYISAEKVEIMSSEIDRIHLIVEEFLILSKPHKRVEECFYFQEAMDYVVNVMKLQAGNGINIEVIALAAHNYCVFGDRNQLIQVFINLVKNSIEAMPNGGKISISTQYKDEMLEIKVSDNGVGIPLERLPQISEPFFTLKEKGMGLGLTISQKIISEHHGHFDIQSEQDKGTTVIVKLPVHKDESEGFDEKKQAFPIL